MGIRAPDRPTLRSLRIWRWLLGGHDGRRGRLANDPIADTVVWDTPCDRSRDGSALCGGHQDGGRPDPWVVAQYPLECRRATCVGQLAGKRSDARDIVAAGSSR